MVWGGYNLDNIKSAWNDVIEQQYKIYKIYKLTLSIILKVTDTFNTQINNEFRYK